MVYRHVQYGYFGIGTLVLMVLIGVFSLPETFDESVVVGSLVTVTMVVIAVLVIVFSRLEVKIEDAKLTASFGFGWPQKVVDLSDVGVANPVRNTWVQGWGVRKITGGWMYNVWGLDAIDFEMQSGERSRIGTNDAQNLLQSARVFTG